MALHRRQLPDGSEITELDGVDRVTSSKKPKGRRPDWLTRALSGTMLADFRNEYLTLDGFELIGRFNEVVGLRYHLDPSVAGIHTACVSCHPGDRSLYYAAVHRFQGKTPGSGRQVVCGYRDSTMRSTLLNLVGVWFECIKTEGEDGTVLKGSPFEDVPQIDDLSPLLQKSIDEVIKRKGQK